MTLIKVEIRDKLLTKAIRQKEFAQLYKEKRITSWNLNEELMNPDKLIQSLTDKDISGGVVKRDTKADVPLYDLHGFKDTFLSKIKTPLSFKYIRGDIGDDRKAKLINALKERSSKVGRWSFYDLMGKDDAITYGRAIYFYISSFSTKKGYKDLLKLIDPKDFLIDPEVGGICLSGEDDSIEDARYMGWWNVKITRKELNDGVKEGIYYKEIVDKILSKEASNSKDTQQETDKQNRLPIGKNHTLQDEDVFTFYAWFLKDEDDRKVYMIFDASGTNCIRAEYWSKIRKSDMYPIWTWASCPDPREFWSPSPIDYYRGISIAKQKSINQMLDNAERINDPPRAVNIEAVRNPSQVRARKGALIEIQGEMTAQNALQVVQTPSIDTPLAVYDKLDAVSQGLTGLTAGMRGDSKEEVVSVYEGNKEEAQDRFALMSRSYSEGYYRFATLVKEGYYQDLRKEEAVEIVGSQGLDMEYVKRTDIRPTGRDYNVIVESNNAEALINSTTMKNKVAFLGKYRGADQFNQQVLIEEEAKLVGYDDTDIKRFLSTDDYEKIDILSQAEEAFQFVILGKPVPPYKTINTAFVERVNDLWRAHSTELSDEQNTAVLAYLNESLNLARENAGKEAMIEAQEQEIEMQNNAQAEQMAKSKGMQAAANGPIKLSTPTPIEQQQEGGIM